MFRLLPVTSHCNRVLCCYRPRRKRADANDSEDSRSVQSDHGTEGRAKRWRLHCHSLTLSRQWAGVEMPENVLGTIFSVT